MTSPRSSARRSDGSDRQPRNYSTSTGESAGSRSSQPSRDAQPYRSRPVRDDEPSRGGQPQRSGDSTRGGQPARGGQPDRNSQQSRGAQSGAGVSRGASTGRGPKTRGSEAIRARQEMDKADRRSEKGRAGRPASVSTSVASQALFAAEQLVSGPDSRSFIDLGVPAALLPALTAMGADAPFPIQSATLEATLSGRDVLGRGRTGSGKTIAFAIPLVTRLAGGRAGQAARPEDARRVRRGRLRWPDFRATPGRRHRHRLPRSARGSDQYRPRRSLIGAGHCAG